LFFNEKSIIARSASVAARGAGQRIGRGRQDLVMISVHSSERCSTRFAARFKTGQETRNDRV
jgi:hypothetical protein